MDALAPSAGKRRNSASGRKPNMPNVFRIPSNISVTLGLQWQFVGEEPIDLDASCVAFDKDCNAIEAAFFNHLEAEEKYMIHSGDNRTGEDDGDDDETITFHMSKIPENIHYMMVSVTSYNGADFRLVESAVVRVINNADGKVVGKFALSVVGQHTASLLCVFSRAAKEESRTDRHAGSKSKPMQYWDLREINKPCFGFSFCDLLPEMLKLLGIEDPTEIESRVQTLPDYSLEKTNDVADMQLSQLRFGLGWDGENDLDASLVMVDEHGNYVDHVHAKYGKLRSADGSTLHSGDKLNGYAVQGDDEFIDVNLMIVDTRVKAIYFVVLLYDGLADALNEVPKCYARMQNKASPNDRNHTEIARVDLNEPVEQYSAVVAFVAVRQSQTHWEKPLRIVDVGMGGRDWVDIFPFLRTFHRLNANVEEWASWGEDVYPFAIKVTFGEIKNLGPQEPHYFRCHCLAWIHDKRMKRFRTGFCANRHNVQFTESVTFILDKMDVLRVMVYETAMVGWVDIPMTPFFGKRGYYPPVNWPATDPASPTAAKNSGVSKSVTQTEVTPIDDGAVEMRMIPSRSASLAPVAAAAAGPRYMPSGPWVEWDQLPPEGAVLADQFFPLVGEEVTGEVRLRIERVPMPDVPKNNRGGSSGSGGGGCVVA